MAEFDHPFPVRIQRTSLGVARAYARTQSFDIGSQASVRETDDAPSAVEYVLGALGGHTLEQEASGAGAEGAGEDLLVLERGEDENRRRAWDIA